MVCFNISSMSQVLDQDSGMSFYLVLETKNIQIIIPSADIPIMQGGFLFI